MIGVILRDWLFKRLDFRVALADLVARVTDDGIVTGWRRKSTDSIYIHGAVNKVFFPGASGTTNSSLNNRTEGSPSIRPAQSAKALASRWTRDGMVD
jgi:hypothetical protein